MDIFIILFSIISSFFVGYSVGKRSERAKVCFAIANALDKGPETKDVLSFVDILELELKKLGWKLIDVKEK